jgi:hypothetical protein
LFVELEILINNKIKIWVVYFVQFFDRKIIAAAAVTIIRDHIAAGVHHVRTIIINASHETSNVVHGHVGPFIGVVFLATFLATFFVAIVCSYKFS